MASSASLLRRLARRVFDGLGINRSIAFAIQFGDAWKMQRKLVTAAEPLIMDVGAFDGRSAIQYHKLFPLATIHSFEPFPDSFQKLQAAKVHATRHMLHPIALSNEAGEARFYVNSYTATNSLLPSSAEGLQLNEAHTQKEVILVQQQTLDSYCQQQAIQKIDVLKLDVQGAELKVLQGCAALLTRKAIGLIYAEVEFIPLYENQPLYHDIAAWLHNYGYRCFGLYNLAYRRNGQLTYGDAIFIPTDPVE